MHFSKVPVICCGKQSPRRVSDKKNSQAGFWFIPSIVVPVPTMLAPSLSASPGMPLSMRMSPLSPSFPPKSCRVVQMNGAPKKLYSRSSGKQQQQQQKSVSWSVGQSASQSVSQSRNTPVVAKVPPDSADVHVEWDPLPNGEGLCEEERATVPCHGHRLLITLYSSYWVRRNHHTPLAASAALPAVVRS